MRTPTYIFIESKIPPRSLRTLRTLKTRVNDASVEAMSLGMKEEKEVACFFFLYDKQLYERSNLRVRDRLSTAYNNGSEGKAWDRRSRSSGPTGCYESPRRAKRRRLFFHPPPGREQGRTGRECILAHPFRCS
jgi:hypothetical protein